MIERVEEDLIGPEDLNGIAHLLNLAFPGFFGDRIYFKQLPNFRLLAKEGRTIVGHAAVIWRAARLGKRPIRIFGIVDLCVAEDHRRSGIGSALVAAVVAAAKRGKADFLLVFADDPRLYTGLGFTRQANVCVWLAIDDHTTLGIKTDRLGDCLMVLRLGPQVWDEDAELDLLGHVF